ncbi:ATP-binding cassette domain-containing protein [Streptomyces sp. SID5770]|uniref:ABC transporter ATP-binding protein n=1 Tax=Streptomyces sp. SID5770 TaxID=2690308 RepID=UPI001370B40C|nr:ABC transporter ATP-binding protein [Streptomyces sp. SID5770]MZE55783.1 ATP-binding cassette domain-containing protein [Streptomyces sp. SID5770]
MPQKPHHQAAPAALAAHALTKHYPVRRTPRDLTSRRTRQVHAVDALDLTLHAGRVTALVGESGSGKSTVARLLAGLEPVTSGTVSLHGDAVRIRNYRSFRAYCAEVQLILQDPFASLNPVHTIRHHLTRALRIHRGRMEGDRLARALDELLEDVQLTPPARYLDKYPHELSGGQRQRVSIARALAARPAVLLADEPVSMLDVSIRLGVLNLLRRLTDSRDLAVLYITHDIASARYFADTTAVMYAGQMVESGDSESLTQDPAHPYTRLLISSAPDPDGPPEEGGPSTDSGDPPSLIFPPPGCRFHPRCPSAMERCRSEQPPRAGLGDGRWVACWLYADPAGETATAREQEPAS